MSTVVNSSPAFPSPGVVLPNGRQQGAYEGMTLRDYFAAKALQPLIAGRNWSEFIGSDEELIAQWAKSSYALADAMLAARQGSAA